MSSETSKRRIVEPEQLPRTISVHLDQPVPAEGKLMPGLDPENNLDLDSLGGLQSFFELLGRWEQEEKADEK